MPNKLHLKFNVNGEEHELDNVLPADSLINVLRNYIGLPGTKRGCDYGGCGMCTVLLDGKPVYSCMTPSWKACAPGRVVTIENFSENPEQLTDPLQKAIIEESAFQCGYCTPAMVMVAKALLEKNPNPNESEVRAALCGVLCRCTNYSGYINAILRASKNPRH